MATASSSVSTAPIDPLQPRMNLWSPPRPLSDPGTAASDIQLPGFRELGALLDEAEARLRLGTHEAVHRRLGRRLVVEHLDPEQGALPRVHGGLLQLRGHHFAEALEAADLDL